MCLWIHTSRSRTQNAMAVDALQAVVEPSGAATILSWEGLIKKKLYYIRGATAPKSQDRLK